VDVKYLNKWEFIASHASSYLLNTLIKASLSLGYLRAFSSAMKVYTIPTDSLINFSAASGAVRPATTTQESWQWSSAEA
jgi:hypothetical protein